MLSRRRLSETKGHPNPKTKPQPLTHRDKLGVSIADDNGEEVGGFWGLGAAIAPGWMKKFVRLG
jgi:hypothetical protein